jgi:hypothetical protein
VFRLIGKHGTEGEPSLFFVHDGVVVARGGTVYDPAFAPVRGANRALSGASRVLLAPRFASAAAHFGAALHIVRALTQVRQLRHHRAMHHARLAGRAEQAVAQFDLAYRLTLRVI